MVSSQDPVTKECLLSAADASALEIHIVALFGRDNVIARRNEVRARTAMDTVGADTTRRGAAVDNDAIRTQPHVDGERVNSYFSSSSNSPPSSANATLPPRDWIAPYPLHYNHDVTRRVVLGEPRASHPPPTLSSEDSSSSVISPLDLRVSSRRGESRGGHGVVFDGASSHCGLEQTRIET